jgi:hypothetical protein
MLKPYYQKIENKEFICNNFNLLWRCAERADLIYEYQQAENIIEYGEFIEYVEYLKNDGDKLDYEYPEENRELGFL